MAPSKLLAKPKEEHQADTSAEGRAAAPFTVKDEGPVSQILRNPVTEQSTEHILGKERDNGKIPASGEGNGTHHQSKKRILMEKTITERLPQKKMKQNIEVSSSPEPADEPSKYRDQEAEKIYNKFFMNRPIVVERKVILKDFAEQGVEKLFTDLRWKSLFSGEGTAYPFTVRHFYTNMFDIKDEEPSFKTFVRGQVVRVSSTVVCHALGLHRPKNPVPFPSDSKANIGEGKEDLKSLNQGAIDQRAIYRKEICESEGDGYYSNLNTAALKQKYRIIYQIVRSNLLPIKGSKNVVRAVIAEFLYLLGTSQVVDIGTIIVVRMIEIFRAREYNRCAALPYAKLIHRVLASRNIDIDETEPVEDPMEPLTKKYLTKSEAAKKTRAPPEAKKARAPPKARPSSSPASTRIEEKLDRILSTQAIQGELLSELIKANAVLHKQYTKIEREMGISGFAIDEIPKDDPPPEDKQPVQPAAEEKGGEEENEDDNEEDDEKGDTEDLEDSVAEFATESSDSDK